THAENLIEVLRRWPAGGSSEPTQPLEPGIFSEGERYCELSRALGPHYPPNGAPGPEPRDARCTAPQATPVGRLCMQPHLDLGEETTQCSRRDAGRHQLIELSADAACGLMRCHRDDLWGLQQELTGRQRPERMVG